MRNLRCTSVALFVAVFTAVTLFTTGAFAQSVQSDSTSKTVVAHTAVTTHAQAARPFGFRSSRAFRGGRFFRGGRNFRRAGFFRGGRNFRRAGFFRGGRNFRGGRFFRNRTFFRRGISASSFAFANAWGAWAGSCCSCFWECCNPCNFFGWGW